MKPVWVIDDDRSIRWVFEKALAREGIPYKTFAAAQEAILLPPEGTDFDEEIRRMEVALLSTALHRSGGSKTAASRLLNIDTQRIKYLCRKYGL